MARMICAADPYSALIDAEHALPGLSLLLDLPRLARTLEQHSGETIDSLQPVYLRHKRRTNCLVAYRATGSIGDTILHAKAVHSKSAGAVPNGNADRVRTWLGDAPLAVARLGVTIWAMPDDARLKQLRYVADEQGHAELTRRAPQKLPRGPLRFRQLSYKPQRRFVAAVHAAGHSTPTAVIRMYTAAGYDTARGRAKFFQSREWLSVARQIGRDRRRRLLFFDWCAGESAANLVAAPEPLAGHLELAGRALAEMHNQAPDPAMPESPANDAEAVLNGLAELRVMLPSLAGRLALLHSRLEALPPGGPWSSIHGDLHLGQLIVGPSSVSVIDFDRSGAGLAVTDLASCRAALERDVAGGTLSPARAEAAFDEFLAGYGRMRQLPAVAVLDAYTAAAIARILPEPFRTFHPAMLTTTERLLDRALTLVSASDTRQNSVVIGATQPRAADDPAMPFVRRALDPAYLQSHLDDIIGRQVQAVSSTVTRWKPGRRCVIEYVVAVAGAAAPMTLIGKVRARSFDHATYTLTKQLADRLSQSDQTPLAAVPAARGAVPECHLWLQDKVDGATGWNTITAPDGVDVARKIGQALARLHRAFPPLLKTHGITEELAILADRLDRVCATHPSLTTRVRSVERACRQLAATLPAAERSGIHRDFYHDQVIVEGDRVWILDLDLAAEGDPALDVGNFIAHLSEQALRLRGDSRALATHESALIDGFYEAGGRAAADAIAIYRTLTLARHIYITTLLEERQPFTGAILSLCEQQLHL